MYNQPSFARCFSNIDDSGYGTEANPCKCLDGTEQYSTKTRANLTLLLSPTSPPPSAPTGSITASGKLTDNKGNGISGKTIKINRVNANTPPLDASSTFTTTTATDGGFTLTSPVPCSDTATLQAIFDGDTTYTFAVSNPVALTIGGTPVCIASSYDSANPPVASILSTSFCQNLCSVKNFASDGQNHCGWKFLRLTMDSSSTKNGDYYILKPDNELWEFFLTNKTDYGVGDFNIKASSYTNGLNTYDCAILVTEEITNAPDGLCVYWVKEGVEIRTNGSSLQKDIEISGSENGVSSPYSEESCNPLAIGAFGTNGGNCSCGAIVVWTNGTEDIWQAHYTDSPILDRCGDCSFSTSNTQYRPNRTIVCKKDAGYGTWRVK
ncbi:hypothetical protein KKG29_01510 [Patescibacteria group bacterium]|nr:hypothetical protein [Patescibacteria group bacterium]